MTRYLIDRLSVHKMLHQHYRDQLKAALHTCSFQSWWRPQRRQLTELPNLTALALQDSALNTNSAALGALSSLTKCFTLTDCSEGIRDPTGIHKGSKKTPKAVEAGKMMAPRVFQYLLLKWQILLVKTKHMNCVKTATLSYNRAMRWQRKNSISL